MDFTLSDEQLELQAIARKFASERVSPRARELDRLADQLRYVGENVGFHFLVGHGIGTELIEQMFEAAAAFLTAPATVKQAIAMDSAAVPPWPTYARHAGGRT